MIEICFNPIYAETNSMYALYNTREILGDKVFLLLVESDLIFKPAAIRSLLLCEVPDVIDYSRNQISRPVLRGTRFGTYSYQLFCQKGQG